MFNPASLTGSLEMQCSAMNSDEQLNKFINYSKH